MNTMKRKWLIPLALALLISIAALPALAEKNATSGSGADTSVFFVESYGNAKVVFNQSEGMCHELSYTHLVDGIQGDEEEWGKYHIYVYTPYGSSYVEDWDKTFNGGSYTLSLNGAGIYRIRVVPYTGSEMTDSWTLDKFISWTTYPRWWISEQRNCSCMANLNVSVYVQQVDQNTGAVLSSRTVTLNFGNNSVSAGSNPSGYTLVSSSTANVYVDSSGRPDKNTVTFYYKRNTPSSASVTVYCYDQNGNYIQSYTETISSGKTINPKSISGYTATSSGQYVSFSNGSANPSSITFYYKKNSAPVPQPSHGTVRPTGWDTQFKPGYCRQDNETKYRDLYKLYDDNSSTAFWWVIWKSERTDSIPEITAYFNGDTVSSIGIRNGRLDSYTQYARAARFRVRITHSGGTSTTYVYIPDVKDYGYQTFSLGGTYSGVTRIELFLDGGDGEGFYSGTKEKYYLYISDIMFSN